MSTFVSLREIVVLGKKLDNVIEASKSYIPTYLLWTEKVNELQPHIAETCLSRFLKIQKAKMQIFKIL